MSNPIFWENKKTISKCRLLKFFPSMLSANILLIARDKMKYQVNIFSYFSMKTYAVGTH